MTGCKRGISVFTRKAGSWHKTSQSVVPNFMRELSDKSKITFLNAKLQRIEAFHHLPCIILWKDSGNPEKSQYAYSKAEYLSWMCVNFEQIPPLCPNSIIPLRNEGQSIWKIQPGSWKYTVIMYLTACFAAVSRWNFQRVALKHTFNTWPWHVFITLVQAHIAVFLLRGRIQISSECR